MTDRPVESRDEIELIEILRVVWKWKYLILVGTLVFAVIAGVISFNRPKTYRVDMVLQPGLVGVDEIGKKIHIDSPANMKALIEAGTLNKKIKSYLKTLNIKNRSPLLKLKISTPKKSNILKISYETSDVDIGIKILDHLPTLLLREYSEAIKQFANKYQTEITSKLEEISFLENEKRIAQNSIPNIQKRLTELTLELKTLKYDNDILIQKRNSEVNKKNENSVNMTLLYSNTIQKNLELINMYKNQSFDYLSKKKRTEFTLKRIQEKLELMAKEVEDLKKEKNNIEYIQVLRPPTSSAGPVKPMTKLNVMLAAVVGFFLTVFLAFLIEYLSKQKKLK